MDEKFYYSIGEVAEMLGTSTSQLRYWSGEFDLNVRKNRKGDRLFQKEDLVKLKAIQRMLKDEGYTIDGAKKKLKKDKGIVIPETTIEVESKPIIHDLYPNVFIQPEVVKPLILITQTNEIIVSLRSIKSKLEILKGEIDAKL
jgi:DNA-binding transcriptional MerR regulator